MFFLKSMTQPMAPPEPEAIPVDALAIPDEEYRALARKLGVDMPTETTVAKIQKQLVALGCRIYDRAKVAQWLDKQYGKPRGSENARWIWRPLREDDRSSRGSSWSDIPSANNRLAFSAERYDKPVPYPVLLTVEKVLQEFRRANFYVSDEVREQDRVKDPFLMVLIENQAFIIERWDEPGYRE